MARKTKEPREPVTVRVPTSLRTDLRLLAQQDKRDDEADYWRKVLSDHVDEMRKAGKLPLSEQLALPAAEVEVHAVGVGR